MPSFSISCNNTLYTSNTAKECRLPSLVPDCTIFPEFVIPSHPIPSFNGPSHTPQFPSDLRSHSSSLYPSETIELTYIPTYSFYIHTVQPMADPRTGAARKSSSASSSAAEFAQSPQQQQGNSKVPIPRLRPSATRDDGSGGSTGASGGDRHRVPHACEPCRQRKTKVRAEKPYFIPSPQRTISLFSFKIKT